MRLLHGEAGASEHLMQLENVGVSYSRPVSMFRRQHFRALLDVSFDVERGETLGVIGHNGSGKSTLLQVMAGIIAPSSGRIRNLARSTTLLSLQLGFLPHLTGRQNAILSGMLLGLPRRQIVERLPEIVAFSELGEFLDVPLGTYSNGMRARLGFAVALQCDPELLLIDEVLGVGDAPFRQRSAQALRDKIAAGRTVVLVSHNLDTVRSLCTRVAWLEAGGCRAVGEPARIVEAYLDETRPGVRGRASGARRAQRSE